MYGILENVKLSPTGRGVRDALPVNDAQRDHDSVHIFDKATVNDHIKKT
jgi:hypothetical protein